MSGAYREREVKNDSKATVHDSATIKESHVLSDSIVGGYVTITSSLVRSSRVHSHSTVTRSDLHNTTVDKSTVTTSRLTGCTVLRSALRDVDAFASVFTGVTITGCGTRLIGAEITDPGHYVRLVDTPWTPVVVYRCPGGKGWISVGCRTFPVTPRTRPENIPLDRAEVIPPGLLAMWDGLVDAAVALENLWIRERQGK